MHGDLCGPMDYKSFQRSLILSGINRATCNASPTRCANKCRAAVVADHPFDFLIARKTNKCCCQQPVPSNLGAAVLVNLCGPPTSGPSGQARPNLRGPVKAEFIKVLTPCTHMGSSRLSEFFFCSSSSPRLCRQNAILVTGTKM